MPTSEHPQQQWASQPRRSAADQAAWEAEFLRHASELLASSLDYDRTLRQITELAVHGLADWCAFDELDEQGGVRRIAVAHPDPARVQLAYELAERYPPDPAATHGLLHVLRTGRPELVEEIPDALLAELARDAKQLRVVRELGLRSYIIVPLIARGSILGALTLVSAESGRRYGAHELALADNLARRAAPALDNARLFREAARARAAAESAAGDVRDILDGIGDPFVVQDAEWRFRYVNSAAAAIFRGSSTAIPDSLLGSVLWDVFPDLVGTPFETEMRRARDQDVMVTFEQYYARDGIWSEMRCYPLRNGGLATTWKDITEKKRAEESLHFLSGAGAILGSSLDYQVTLTAVARLLVPRLADWCSVSILDDDGELRQLAVAHVDPDKVRFAYELNDRYPPDPDATHGVYEVIRTGKPELLAEIPDELLVAGTVDEEHLRIARELGLRSALTVPLIARRRTLGAISLVSAESGCRYDDADLGLAMELARRAALAVDNARLHQESEESRERLEEQAAELEMQAEELQAQAVQLEESQAELETSIDELRETNERLGVRTEEAEAARSQTAGILESITDGFYALDEDWRFIFVNRRGQEMLGRSRDELIGGSIWELYPELMGNQFEEEYLRAMETGKPSHFEGFVAKSGRWYAIALHPSREGLAVYFQNVTERVRSEQEIRRWAERADQLHALTLGLSGAVTANDVAVLLGTRGRDILGARAAVVGLATEDGTALDRVEMVGYPANPQDLWRRVPIEGRIPLTEAMRGRGAIVFHSAEARRAAFPEMHFPAEYEAMIALPILLDDRVLGAWAVHFDRPREFSAEDLALFETVTAQCAQALDRSRLFEREHAARMVAEDASQAKSGFLATMSHELRTPLNAMIGYADLLMMGIPDKIPDGAYKQVERIGRAARHLLSVIEEILTFSRLDVGRETVEIEVVDLAELVGEVNAIIEPLADAKGIGFRAPADAGLGSLETDPRKLRQILINLLGNAVKFTGRGEVSFEIEIVEESIVFRVTDTGLGIAPEHLEDIFEAFRQVDDRTTRSAEGTGLGLAVSRRLARLLDGDVTVESAAGRGSTFTCRLPLA